MNKSIYLSLLGAALLAPAFAVSAAAPGNRVIYGFNMGSAEWADATIGKTYDCGFVSYPFDLSEEGTVLHSYLPTPSTGVYAGTGVEGIIYACEYIYTTSTQQPQATDLVAYNVYSGKLERIGQWNPNQTDLKPSDMTYDMVSGKLYAVGFANSRSSIYEVDMNTAAFTRVCDLKTSMNQPFTGGTLAADAKGQLYTINSDGGLYTINLANGRTTLVYETGLSGMLQNQTMEFDHTTGKLYWASNTQTHPAGNENQWLQEIDLSDPDNITMTEIGNIGIMSRFMAMYIPYADSTDAPAAPTNVKSVAGENGALAATITWTNPTTTFNGGELGTLYGVVVKRNGEVVKYLSDPVAGEEMSFTDTEVPAKGHYRYDIQVVNEKGNGAKGTAFQFVGADRPGEVSNITGTPGTDMRSITLTWDAPTDGFYFGSFNPADVKYTIKRSDNTVVAENITETTVTDSRFVRLMAYTYTVIATNDEGETPVTSGSFILGPAVQLPLEQTFENEAQIRNRWTAIDGNNDTFTWMFGTTLGQAMFGDFESSAEYISSPTLGITGSADEWLISPPMALEAGVEYEVTVSGRSYSSADGSNLTDEVVDIHFGTTNNVASMTEQLGTINIAANETDPETGTMAFVRQSVALPVMAEDATRCVGIHLVTPQLYSGYLQINGIFVGEKGEYNAVSDIAVDNAEASISLNGRTLAIFGEFSSAVLYNLQGAAVAAATSPVMNLDGINAGVYVLNVDGKSFKIAVK